MSCSRRQFIIYSGALAAVGGVSSHTLANTMNRWRSLRHGAR